MMLIGRYNGFSLLEGQWSECAYQVNVLRTSWSKALSLRPKVTVVGCGVNVTVT
jgi:hypothetical protein